MVRQEKDNDGDSEDNNFCEDEFYIGSFLIAINPSSNHSSYLLVSSEFIGHCFISYQAITRLASNTKVSYKELPLLLHRTKMEDFGLAIGIDEKSEE